MTGDEAERVLREHDSGECPCPEAPCDTERLAIAVLRMLPVVEAAEAWYLTGPEDYTPDEVQWAEDALIDTVDAYRAALTGPTEEDR